MFIHIMDFSIAKSYDFNYYIAYHKEFKNESIQYQIIR